MFCNMIRFYGEGLLASRPNRSYKTTPYRLSATAQSIYSQLISVSGCSLLHPQPEDAPCRPNRLIMALCAVFYDLLLES
jgi:hypothetical protein